MSEYNLKIKKNRNAEALLSYLRSLDYVEIQEKAFQKSKMMKEAAQNLKGFLQGLPEMPYAQSDVNEVIKEIRSELHES
jgi:outer membrane protein assembly factor BamD (BamD/ComL family)